MSLSNPKVTNPCKKFIEFKGNTGVFQYWDKEAKKNVELKMPVKFIVLDELCNIQGFSDSAQAGIYSNEVRNLNDQILNVRVFKSKISKIGRYADIKGEISAMGGKFCKSVYAALIHGDDLELVNFQLKGISFKSWLDKGIDLSLNGVAITKCDDGKKGAVKYKIPIYEALPVSHVLMEKAVAMDKTLQLFLSTYLSNNDHDFVQHSPEEEQEAPKHYNEKAITPASASHRGEPAAFDGPPSSGEPPDDLEDDDIKF